MQVGTELDLQLRHHPHRYLITHQLPPQDPFVMPADEDDLPHPSQETDDPEWKPLSAKQFAVYTTIVFTICLVYFIRCVTAIAEQMGL